MTEPCGSCDGDNHEFCEWPKLKSGAWCCCCDADAALDEAVHPEGGYGMAQLFEAALPEDAAGAWIRRTMRGQRPTIVITAADDRGVPTHARCSCGWQWERPDGDEWADMLPIAARGHPHYRVTIEGGRPAVSVADDRDWVELRSSLERVRGERDQLVATLLVVDAWIGQAMNREGAILEDLETLWVSIAPTLRELPGARK